jgi:hypothetical protein
MSFDPSEFSEPMYRPGDKVIDTNGDIGIVQCSYRRPYYTSFGYYVKYEDGLSEYKPEYELELSDQ